MCYSIWKKGDKTKTEERRTAFKILSDSSLLEKHYFPLRLLRDLQLKSVCKAML